MSTYPLFELRSLQFQIDTGSGGANIVELSSSAILTREQSGSYITSRGASAGVTVTLPDTDDLGSFRSVYYLRALDQALLLTPNPSDSSNIRFSGGSLPAGTPLNLTTDDWFIVVWDGSEWLVYDIPVSGGAGDASVVDSFTPVDDQTVFNLSQQPIASTDVVFDVNGVGYYSPSFSLSGPTNQTLTWANEFQIKTGDKVHILYHA